MDVTNVDRQIGSLNGVNKAESAPPAQIQSNPEKPTRLQYLKAYFEKNRLRGLTTIREQLRRDKVAEELKWARSKERAEYVRWGNYRPLKEYDEKLNGMKSSIEYVIEHQKELGSNLFVDIAAGKGNAADQLSRTELGEKLDVQMTNIVKPREQKINPLHGKGLFANLVSNLVLPGIGRLFEGMYTAVPEFPPGKTHITSAEVMRGFKDNSIAYICSVLGVSYSADPEMAMKTLTEKLVPGGVMKLFMATNTGLESETPSPIHHPTEFARALESMGYKRDKDLYITQSAETPEQYILLAIKPGSQIGIRAVDLFYRDQHDYQNRQSQTDELAKQGFPSK